MKKDDLLGELEALIQMRGFKIDVKKLKNFIYLYLMNLK